MLTNFDLLKQDLLSGNVIAFVGAGVSMASTKNHKWAEWKGLMEEGVKYCRDVYPSLDDKWEENITARLQSTDFFSFLPAVSELDNRLRETDKFGLWLSETIGNLKCEDQSVIKAIIDLGIPIVTTNYDGLIEEVSGYKEITWKEEKKLHFFNGRYRGKNGNRILHLHGHWEDPDSIILGEKSYQNIRNHKFTQAILKAISSLKTILFIGFGEGINDPNFQPLRKWMTDTFQNVDIQHYRLVQKGSPEQLSHNAKEKIKLVEYGAKHADLAPFLRSLRGEEPGELPENKPEPDDADDILKQYLLCILEHHTKLVLYGIPEAKVPSVNLDQVYVALKVDRTSTEEILEENLFIEDEVMEYFTGEPGEEVYVDPHIREVITSEILKKGRGIPIAWQNQNAGDQVLASGDIITLGEAFQNERWLVILGDPGSGKTTLARWLTLQLAKAYLAGNDRVSVPKYQIDPNHPDDGEVFDLGITRLPVIVRISDYAEQYARKLKEGEILDLVDYLPDLRWNKKNLAYNGKTIPSAALKRLFLKHFAEGKAVVIFDGMDEVVENRGEIVVQIQNFIEEYINNNGDLTNVKKNIFDYSTLNLGKPVDKGGNQVIVTSRIVGYQSSPIKANLTRVFIEPMGRTAVERFSHTWTQAIFQEIYAGQKTTGEIAKMATDEAVKLIEAIFNENKPQIQKLASNPLLITILALVFRQNKGALPQQRAELYETAMKRLFKTWRETPLKYLQLQFILAPLAYHMQANVPSGMIGERELRTILLKQLATYHNIQSPHLTPPNFREVVEDFVREVTDNVGILASRADKLFGFLHLTFQEYLAAVCIINDPDIASIAARIREKISEPRWREVILLAFSNMSIEKPKGECEAVMLELLKDDSLQSELLPTNALILVSAFDDMKTSAVTDKVVKIVIELLLKVYSNKRLTEQFPALIGQIEKAFTLIKKLKKGTVVDTTLIGILRSARQNDSDIVPAIATLVYKKKWFSEPIISQLFKAIDMDNHAWDYPINRICNELLLYKLTGTRSDDTANFKKPVWTRDLEELSASEPKEYKKLRIRYEIAYRLYIERRDELSQQVYDAETIFENGFKKYLQAHPESQEYIRQHAFIHRLVTAQFGGYLNYGSIKILTEYKELAAFLQQPDVIVDSIIDDNPAYYIGNWGFEHIFYNCQTYLDTGQNGKSDLVKTPPEFSFDAIFKTSVIDDVIIDSLKYELEKEKIVAQLHKRVNGSETEEVKASALIALLALGQDIVPRLNKLKDTDTYRLTLSKLKLISYELEDAIVRGKDIILNSLPGLQLTGIKGQELIEQLIKATLSSCKFPIDLSKLVAGYSDSTALPAEYLYGLQGDKWFYSLVGSPDDVTYNFAVVLDNLPKNEALLAVLYNINLSPNVRFAKFTTTYKWIIPDLLPNYKSYTATLDFLDIIDGLDGFDRIDPKNQYLLKIGFKEQVIMNLRTVLESNRGMLPEILVYSLQNNIWKVISVFAPRELAMSHNPIVYLFSMINSIADPYLKCSALLRYLKFLAKGRDKIIRFIIKESKQIKDNLLQARIVELTIPYLTGKSATTAVHLLSKLTYDIEDPGNKALALLRLSKLHTGNEKEQIVKEAFDAVINITDETERIGIIKRIKDFLPASDYYGLFQMAANSFEDKYFAFIVLNRLSFELVNNQDEYFPTAMANPDTWTPVLLHSLVNDTIETLEETNFDHWKNLLDPEAHVWDAALGALLNAGEKNGIVLTGNVARYIEILYDNEQYNEYFNLLMPLLDRPTSDAVPILEKWMLQAGEGALKDLAALLLAERNSTVNANYINGIVNCLEYANDRIRLKAELLLTNGISKVTTERIFRVSQIGKETIEIAASLMIDATYKQLLYKHRVLRMFLYHVVYDVPGYISELCRMAENDNNRKDVALCILKNISEATEDTWAVIKTGYTNGNEAICNALSQSLLWMIYKENKQEFQPEGIVELLRSKKTPDENKFLLLNWAIILDTINEHAQGKREFESIEKSLSGNIVTLHDLLQAEKPDIDTAIDSTCHWDGSYIKSEYLGDVILDFHFDSFRILVTWLEETLHKGVFDTPDTFTLCSSLLDLAALLADYAPTTFTRICKEKGLAKFIIEASQQHHSVVGRRAATELIAYIPKIDQSAVAALISALGDDIHVTQAAIKCIKKINLVDRELLNSLYSLIYHGRASVSMLAIQLLSVIGKNENTLPSDRSEILQQLTLAIKNVSTKKGFYQLAGEGSIDNPYKIRFVNRVDKVLYKAMLEVSGWQ